MTDEDKLVVLKVCQSLPEAEIIKSYLAEHGVETFLHDKHLNTMYAGALGGVTGGYRIRIRETELKQAQLILSKQNPALEDEFLQGDACPHCKSTKTCLVQNGRLSLIRFIFGFLYLLPTGKSRGEKWKCEDCQNEWWSNDSALANWKTIVFTCLVIVSLYLLASAYLGPFR